MSGDEFMDMAINQGSKFPTQTEHDMIASGTTGDGLIKTLNTGHPYFCTHYPCVYSAEIQVRNIKEIVFLPSVFDNESTITIKNNLEIQEELEANEVVKYKINLENGEGKKILFLIEPTMSETEMYMQPDAPLEDLSKSQYITSGKGLQEMIFTPK